MTVLMPNSGQVVLDYLHQVRPPAFERQRGLRLCRDSRRAPRRLNCHGISARATELVPARSAHECMQAYAHAAA